MVAVEHVDAVGAGEKIHNHVNKNARIKPLLFNRLK